ncbi:PLP-dependent cysteine synthase family protein [Streptomyces tibetensis]|uniref:PLP-dependent cysteine synthase family protein n=1 Tax=Streptomyces tibetensis TaxID=2382123 RepID=UPI0033FF246E
MSLSVLSEPHASVVEATELPRIIRLGENLYGAAFTLMKLLPARFIIDQAESAGILKPGTPVIETSSGTFGLGLALVCRLRGYPLTIVGDSAIDPELHNRLRLLGAQVEIVSDHGHPGGIQGARLDRVEELRRARPESFIPNQYDNPSNPAAYGVVADQLSTTLGSLECLVGPVGSGGSTGGLATALRRCAPELHLVGVDTPGSVLFGCAEGPRPLRGLGSSVHPGNVVHRSYDEVHWVAAAEAFRSARDLYQEHGLFMGPTSGASFQVASWWAATRPGRTVVMVLPDEGYRYQSTVYNDGWIKEQGFDQPARPAAPNLVAHPRECGTSWSYMPWGRRDLMSVMNEAVLA